MDAAGVPIIKGYHGDNQDPAHLKAEAAKIGYVLPEVGDPLVRICGGCS